MFEKIIKFEYMPGFDKQELFLSCMRLLVFASIFILLYGCEDNAVKPWSDPYEPISPYSDPVWHPDGAVIGFNHLPLDSIVFKKNASHPWHYYSNDSNGFWIIHPDGSGQKRVLDFTLHTTAWSNAGDLLALYRNHQLCIIPYGNELFYTSGMRVLVEGSTPAYPSWNSNDTKIAYIEDKVAGLPTGIWIYSFQTDTSEFLCESYDQAVWHSSNDSLLYIRNGAFSKELCWIDIQTKGISPVMEVPDYINDIYKVQISEDSRFIIVLAGAGGTKLYKISLTDKNVELLNVPAFPLSFSLYGSNQMVYQKYRTDDYSINMGNLWIYDHVDHTSYQLTSNVLKN